MLPTKFRDHKGTKKNIKFREPAPMLDDQKKTLELTSQVECAKCHRAFRDGYNLRQHLGRKRPCAPVLEAEDLPTFQEQKNSNRCRFCGRTFSRPDAVKRHQKQNCRILKGGVGLEILYDHVLKRATAQQDRIAELEAERTADRRRLDAFEARLSALATPHSADRLPPTGVTIDASVRVTNNIAIDTIASIYVTADACEKAHATNIFGREDTAHIPAEKVRQILSSAAPAIRLAAAAGAGGHTIRASAIKAVCEAALLIYSDPDHPENITCYIPNKRDGTALVHGAQGWEIQPAPLVLPPMTQNSVGLIFDNQPFEGDLKEYEAILAHLRDSEREFVSGCAAAGRSPCEASMKAILIRNKELLARVLRDLPVVGDN